MQAVVSGVWVMVGCQGVTEALLNGVGKEKLALHLLRFVGWSRL